jgi:hypothetical protein
VPGPVGSKHQNSPTGARLVRDHALHRQSVTNDVAGCRGMIMNARPALPAFASELESNSCVRRVCVSDQKLSEMNGRNCIDTYQVQ